MQFTVSLKYLNICSSELAYPLQAEYRYVDPESLTELEVTEVAG